MIRNLALIFMFIWGVAAGSIAHGSQALECTQLFSSAEPKAHQKYRGVVLTYSPALLINGTFRRFNDHVMIETFEPGAATVKSYALTPYIHYSGIAQPYGREQLHQLGLEAIYQNYGHLVDPAIVSKVVKIEHGLTLDRQATFIARTTDTEKAIGFIRIFDGSIHPDGVRSITNHGLPLEKILKSMNKSTTLVSQLRNQNQHVYEIGKYFINKDLDANDSKLVKSDIGRFVTDYLVTLGHEELVKTYFLAHVASRVHRIAYERYFGFEVAARDRSQNLDANEDLLYIRGDILLQKLRTLQAASSVN
jgi:hypothetical protein